MQFPTSRVINKTEKSGRSYRFDFNRRTLSSEASILRRFAPSI